MGAPINPTYTQNHFLFYESNGTTQVGTEDVETTLDVDVIYYCVASCFDTTANKINDVTIRWQYNLAAGGWVDVGTTTSLQFANGSLTDGDTTQASVTSEAGTFQGSRVYETLDDATIVWSTPGDETDNYGEAWLGFTIDSAQVSDAQEVLIRCILGDGTVFTGTYTNADIDINEGAAPVIETITNATFAVLTEQALLVNDQELLSAATLAVLTGQPLVLLSASVETITAATWAVLTEQSLLVNDQELLGLVSWQALSGQPLTLLGAEIITIVSATLQVLSGQSLNAIDQEVIVGTTWQVLSGQDTSLNVSQLISAGTLNQLVGQIVNALGDEILTINAGTLAQLVEQLLYITVDVTETINNGTWQAFISQPITFASASTEIIGAATFAQLVGKNLTLTDSDPVLLTENLWRTTEETIRIKKSFEITDIDRDYP